MSVMLRLEGVGKKYRLGALNRQSFADEWSAMWARVFKRPDPTTPIHPRTRLTGLDGKSEFWAVKDVSFEMRDGESIGLIGANGAGKSTLLKLLSQITAPTTGRISLNGRVASLLEVGTGFHPELTGRENVYLNGTILGMSRREIQSKFDAITDFSGIGEFLDTPVKRYSSGMRVRLAFAVAAHLEPEIMVVDEVLAVGDAQFRQKCVAKMSEVAREGRAVIFVSHNMMAVEQLCSRGIVLETGNMTFDGPAKEAIQHYLDKVSSSDRAELADRRDRKGSGEIQIDAIELVSESDSHQTTFFPGKPLEIRLHYKVHGSSSTLREAVARIYIMNQYELCVFTLITPHGMLKSAGDSKEGEFRCRIPRLTLTQGSYDLNFELRGATTKGHLIDTLQRAAHFNVEAASVIREEGIVTVDADWDLVAK